MSAVQYTAQDAVLAIQIALEGASSDRAARRVIAEIVRRVPVDGEGNTASVWLLLDAIKAADARLEVTP